MLQQSGQHYNAALYNDENMKNANNKQNHFLVKMKKQHKSVCLVNTVICSKQIEDENILYGTLKRVFHMQKKTPIKRLLPTHYDTYVQ